MFWRLERMNRVSIFVTSCCVAVAACTTPSEPEATLSTPSQPASAPQSTGSFGEPAPSQADNLEGRWIIIRVNDTTTSNAYIEFGKQALGTIVERGSSSHILSPQPPTRARLGCNEWSLNGWDIEGGTLKLGVEGSLMTERGCDSDTMAIEEQAYKILSRATTIERREDIVILHNEIGGVTLQRARSDTPSGEQTLAEKCPNLTAAQIAAIEGYEGQFVENAYYARAYCVSVEEAERRMALQNAGAVGPQTEPGPPPGPPSDSIGWLNQRLQEQESDTLAGLWIRHQPDYRVMVAFTRDGASTLAKYTSDPLFLAVNRPGPTLKEGREKQQSLVEDLNRLGVKWSGASFSESTGRLEVTLAESAAPVRAAAVRGQIDLPDWVDLIEPNPFPVPAPPPPRAGDDRIKAFPQIGYRTDMFPSTLVGLPDVRATLRLLHGCLMLDTPQGSYVALWQQHNSLDLSDPSRVSIVNRFSGSRIAPGDELALTGIQPDGDALRAARQVSDIIGADPACEGPYWLVDGYQKWSDHAAQEYEARIQEIMREERVERARAIELYEIDMARVAQLAAWQDEVYATKGDAVAQIWVNERAGTAHLFHTRDVRPEEIIPAQLDPYVSHQPVPMGRKRLIAEKAILDVALREAGIEAATEIDFMSGHVSLAPADPRLLSEAAVRGAIRFPELTRISLPNAPQVNEYYEGRPNWFESALRELEAAPDFAKIRALVEQGFVLGYATPTPPAPPPSINSRTPGTNQDRYEAQETERPLVRPSRAQSLDIARFMVALGFSAADITALRQVEVDPVLAWEQRNGMATSASNAILMQEVAIAEPILIDRDATSSDGYRSTVTFRVLEPLKGQLDVGDAVTVRLVSGDLSDGTYVQSVEEPILLPALPGSLDEGSRWLLRISQPFYRYIAHVHGGPDAALATRHYVAVDEPRQIIGGMVKLGAPDAEPVPIDEYRAEVSPIENAFERANAVIGQ